MTGLVSDIQKFSVNDGYGIRTIVFLMGCSLRCAWCQNPEALEQKLSLMFNEELCVGCGACVKACPTGASIVRNGRIAIDREKCQNCFECVGACCYDARRPSGKVMKVDEVFDEFIADEVFYRNSGGGLTLSGGEALCQADFCVELLKRVKQAGIHTAIETAGNVPYSSIQKVIPYIDLFLYDVKFIDNEKQKKWTKASNKFILSNLKRLAKTENEIIVRVPLIPGVNDGEEFRSIVDYVSKLRSVKEIHILPYHTLGAAKYTQLDMEDTMTGHREDNDEQVQQCMEYAKKMGFRVSIGGAGF